MNVVEQMNVWMFDVIRVSLVMICAGLMLYWVNYESTFQEYAETDGVDAGLASIKATGSFTCMVQSRTIVDTIISIVMNDV